MSKKNTLGDEALVSFIQALALTIWNLDDLPPEDRRRENFMRGLGGYLEEFIKAAEKEDQDIRSTVQIIRRMLDESLASMKLHKSTGEIQH